LNTPYTTRVQGRWAKGQGHSMSSRVEKFAKLLLTQPGIVQFRSCFVQT